MRSSRIPSYRLHKASQQAVVTLERRDFYLGKYGTADSRDTYDRLISEWLRLRGLPAPPQLQRVAKPKNATIAEAADRYLEWSKSHQNPVEQGHVKGMLKVVLKLFLHEQAANFGPAELRETRRLMLTQNWSRNYVNEQIARVRRWFKWLAAEPLIPITTYQALTVVNGLRRGEDGARETDPVLPVADDVVEMTIVELNDTVADMVRLQQVTGMRPAELCIMRPCDIDRSGSEWKYVPRKHKTQHHGHGRAIIIGVRGQEILLRYLARDAQSCCFRPFRTDGSLGDEYSTAAYRRAIHRACDRTFPHPELGTATKSELTPAQSKGLTKWQSDHRWSPNQLRHSFATKVRKEFGLEAAQVALGHSRADVTQIYAERDLSKAIEVARKIG